MLLPLLHSCQTWSWEGMCTVGWCTWLYSSLPLWKLCEPCCQGNGEAEPGSCPHGLTPYPIGQNLVTWTHLTARKAGKCSLYGDIPILSYKSPMELGKDQFSSVQLFSRVWLWSHGLQHARPPCPSPTPRVYPNSCPLSRWCHPTISSSVVPFSCLQSFPASGFFPMSQFFASSGQSIGVSASISVLPMNIQDWFPLGWTGWISLQSKGLSRIFSNHSSKASVLRCSTLGQLAASTTSCFIDGEIKARSG